jgi:hypothetical protein
MLTTRGMKALDRSRVDHTISLPPTSERLDPSCRAVNHATFHLDPTSAFRSFDHLSHQDVSPRPKPGASATVRSKRVATGLTRGPNVGLQAIGAHQDRPTKRAAAHPFHPSSDQGHIPVLTDFTAKPQTSLDLHGHRHPHDTVLFLNPNLICLHLAKVHRAFHRMLMNGLTLPTCSSPPVGHGSLIEAKRLDNGLYGTAVSQQGEHEDHGLDRVTQAVKHGALGGAEGVSAHLTNEALLLLGMDTHVALMTSSSSRAVPIGAKCDCGVHHVPPRIL